MVQPTPGAGARPTRRWVVCTDTTLVPRLTAAGLDVVVVIGADRAAGDQAAGDQAAGDQAAGDQAAGSDPWRGEPGRVALLVGDYARAVDREASAAMGAELFGRRGAPR